jgi:uncharacterized membrane protein
MATYGQDLLDKINVNKNKDANDIIKEQTKGTIRGSAIGLFLGLYFAHTRNFSLVIGAGVGALVGGFITKQFLKVD